MELTAEQKTRLQDFCNHNDLSFEEVIEFMENDYSYFIIGDYYFFSDDADFSHSLMEVFGNKIFRKYNYKLFKRLLEKYVIPDGICSVSKKGIERIWQLSNGYEGIRGSNLEEEYAELWVEEQESVNVTEIAGYWILNLKEDAK